MMYDEITYGYDFELNATAMPFHLSFFDVCSMLGGGAMSIKSFSIILLSLFVQTAFCQNLQQTRNLDPLKYFELGDSKERFQPFLECIDQAWTKGGATRDGVVHCRAFKYENTTDSFFVAGKHLPNIALLFDSSQLLETIDLSCIYSRSAKRNSKRVARKDYEHLKKYFSGMLQANEENYSGPTSPNEKISLFRLANRNLLLRLTETEGRHKVAAILDIQLWKL